MTAEISPSKRFVVEAPRRLSQSSLWALQRRFYESAGPAAWSKATVPHYVTSNPYIAGAYAEMVEAFVRDVKKPVTVVELGAGSGRFSYYILRRLRDLPVTYVMTDLVERNLEAWRAHPQLKPFVEAGRLDFARFDAERDLAIIPEKSQKHVEGPLLVIANYFFDSIPGDAFVLDGNTLSEARLAIQSPEDEPDVEDPALLERAEFTWEFAPVEGAAYDDPIFSRILAAYLGRAHGRSFVQMPVAALRCLEALRDLSRRELLVLSADKGAVDEEGALSQGPPRVTVHGSISVRVNYHALGEWTRAQGGAVMTAPHRHANIAVVGLALGAGELPETRRAFAAAVGRFGPDEYFTIKKALEPRFEDLTPEQALALVRLSGFDPRVFSQIISVLQKSAATLSAGLARDLVRAVEDVGAMYYHIGESQDFPFKLGLLLFNLKEYLPAMAWFERSLALYGPHPMTYYNLGLCRYRLGEDGEARRWLDQALALDPKHEKALALRTTLTV